MTPITSTTLYLGTKKRIEPKSRWINGGRLYLPKTFSARLSLLLIDTQKRNTAARLLDISGAGRVASNPNLLGFGADARSTMALEAGFDTEVFVLGAQL